MSNFKIYYLISQQLNKRLQSIGVDLDMTLEKGPITLVDLKKQVYDDNLFCRDEESISYKHFFNILGNDIVLYAYLAGKVLGALTFMFNIKEGNKIINFDGICSPKKYSGQHVGEELIHTLIKIGTQNDIRYINLECKGKVVNYYRKFGFKITGTKIAYDSDDDSDDDSEEEHKKYYYMKLDLSEVSGGKRKSKKSNKNIIKRKNSTRKRRKLRKF